MEFRYLKPPRDENCDKKLGVLDIDGKFFCKTNQESFFA